MSNEVVSFLPVFDQPPKDCNYLALRLQKYCIPVCEARLRYLVILAALPYVIPDDLEGPS